VPDPQSGPLLPDPDRLRARLAELAREQAVLRKVLRAVVRGQPSGGVNLSMTPAEPEADEGGGDE
jgi:hypothetical protein